MLFTLNNFVNANKKVIKNMANSNKTNEEIKRFLIEFWNSVCENILEWNLLECKDLSKKSLREDFIITQGVSFLALGLLADFFASNPGINMKQHLFRLRNIDWARNNLRTWSGSAIKSNGKINRNTSGINLTYLTIKHLVDLPLNQTEKNTLERRKA